MYNYKVYSILQECMYRYQVKGEPKCFANF